MPTLRDRFDRTEQKNGFTYISWAQAANRLDDAEPGWSFAIMGIGPDWVHGRLTFADGRFFENIGYAENADAQWKKEVLKDAASDALKRCAALAGVARYLYDDESTTHGAGVPSSPAPTVGAAAGRPSPRPAAPTVPPEPDGLMDDYGAPSAVESARNGRRAPSGDDVYFAEYGTCPDHQVAWKFVPAGTSKKTGKPYNAFYSCPQMGCNEKPTQQWVEMAKAVAA